MLAEPKTKVGLDDYDSPQTPAQLKSEIARVRRHISKAKRVFLIVDGGYSDSAYATYVSVTKKEARRIVGLCRENAEPFDLKWDDDGNLYIPPAYAADYVG